MLPGKNLWLNPYKMAIGAANMHTDAITNLLTTPIIAPFKPRTKITIHYLRRIATYNDCKLN